MRWSSSITDDEDPLPALKRRSTVQAFIHGCHHDTSEHATYLSDGGKDGSSFCYF
jgi:hypothetical protein